MVPMTDSRNMNLRYLVVLLLLSFLPMTAFCALNSFELKVIKRGVKASFNLLIDTWQEELYFEMYDLGQKKSKRELSKSEFAQRMVDLKWKPSLKPIIIEKIHVIYRNFVAIYYIQEFENKVNSLQVIRKRMVLPMILEKEKWRFDLTQLINIPFEGKFVDSDEKPKEKKRSVSQEKQKDASGSSVR